MVAGCLVGIAGIVELNKLLHAHQDKGPAQSNKIFVQWSVDLEKLEPWQRVFNIVIDLS